MDKNEMKAARKLERKRKHKQLRKNKRYWVAIAEIIVIVILLIVLLIALVTGNVLGKFHFLKFNKEDAGINDNLNSQTIQAMKGYQNIAIFGLDNRKTGNYEYGNSDVIMIASINLENKDVKLVSVYRDTTLSIGAQYKGITKQGINKANSAYMYGGYTAAVQMLNANLDLNITDFVCVDWAAVVEAVDALGGLDLTVDQSELKSMNKCIGEINKSVGRDSETISDTGLLHLDGVQACAWCRVRKTEGGDFKRAQRHRIAMEAMLKKAKSSDFATLYNCINAVADDIATSFELSELVDLAKDVASYNLVETQGFPTHLTTSEMFYSCDIPLTLESNVKTLHKFLFGNEDYEPSDVVKSISETIKDVTGTDEDTKTDYNLDDYNNTVGKDGAFE